MCDVTRTFLPVGQGAFYIEQFRNCGEPVNLVFDCGTSTDISIVHRWIDGTFCQGETIQAVLISHLHDDHINGLEYLLGRCRVERIFFPLLDSREKSVILFHYLSAKASNHPSSFFYRFVENPQEYLRSRGGQTDIVYVRPFIEGEESSPEWQLDSQLRSGTEFFYEYVGSGTEAVKWNLIPYHFQNRARTNELIQELERICRAYLPERRISIDSNFRLGEFWSRHPEIRGEIKRAYEKIKGSLNTNSMVVFSGMKTNVTGQLSPFQNTEWNLWSCMRTENYKSGCLYMGDYDCSGKQEYRALRRAYRGYWDKIGGLTIPHHGSAYNYNPELSSSQDRFYIISAGTANPYGHPSSMVVKDMLHKRVPLFLVNEKKESIVKHRIFC